MEGTYKCNCNAGFFGNGYLCLEGECGESFCTGNKKCVSPTTAECECKQGFVLQDDDSCDDIDECLSENYCHRNARCLNTKGSYRKRLTRNIYFHDAIIHNFPFKLLV